MTSSQNPHRAKRSWGRRLLVTFNILLATVLIAGIGVVGYTKWRYGQVSKVVLGDVLRGATGSNQPMNVLMVGSDSREELEAGQTRQFGSATQVAGQRSDTIMILHVEPATQRAAILSLPRDLYVTIADTGKKARINSAFETGPENLIKTIQNNFGIPIDHYVQVNFDSFKEMVDAVGGVHVPFPAPARDYDPSTGRNNTGLNVTKAGCIKLDGAQALAYVRSRHYQTYEGGRWRSDPSADLGRINRQQDFIRRLIKESADSAKNPVTLNSLVATGVKNVKIDENFELGDISRLARRFSTLDPSKVEMMTMPSSIAMVDGASVLLVKQSEAKTTIDRFLNGPPKSAANEPLPEVPAGSISVRVLNGSGQDGAATETSGKLRNANFVVSGVGDGNDVSVTTIRYATGQKSKADTLAKFVTGEVKLTQDSSIKGVDLILTLGTSFEGVREPGTTTTTTTPKSTTTAAKSPKPAAVTADC